MKLLVYILISFALTTEIASGQEKAKIEETYIRKDIPKPFIVRWIKDLFGPGFGQITKLELRTDGTFYYSYYDRYCGTFDYEGDGTWVKENSKLILDPNDDFLPINSNWIINKRRLYASLDSLNNGLWALKKK